MIRKRKKKYKKVPLARYSKTESEIYLKNHVFDNVNFKAHITKVSMMLDVDKKVVTDVIEYLLIYLFVEANTIKKYYREINLMGYLKFRVKPTNYL